MIQLFYIYSDWAILVLRLALAAILIAHGWPKIKNLKATAQNFDGMGFKPGRFWGTVVAVAEFGGGILLLIGLFTQIAAFVLAIQFAVILIWKLRQKQKLVNMGGQSYELDLIIFAALLILMTVGSSFYAADNFFNPIF